MIGKITKYDGENIWFIESGKKTEKKYITEEWVKPEFVKLGEADITIKEGRVTFVAMLDEMADQDSKEKKSTAKKPGEKKWEDDIVSFEDLLTAAHAKAKIDGFSLSIKTEVIKDENGKPLINLKEKFAVFKATVIVSDGSLKQEFQGHGDATSDNVTGDYIKPHFIRMAETRAICRALRWYTNNGCAEEEK